MSESDLPAFAEILARLMEDRGWKQADAARAMGVSGIQIKRYLAGAEPTLSRVVLLARRLGTTVDLLLGLREPTPRIVVIDGDPYVRATPAPSTPAGVPGDPASQRDLQEDKAQSARAAEEVERLEREAPPTSGPAPATPPPGAGK